MGPFLYGGDNRARTCDPLLVRQVLSQLSYTPISETYYITFFAVVKSFLGVYYNLFLLTFDIILIILYLRKIKIFLLYPLRKRKYYGNCKHY